MSGGDAGYAGAESKSGKLVDKPYAQSLERLFTATCCRPSDIDPKAAQYLDAIHAAGKSDEVCNYLISAMENVTRDKVVNWRAYFFTLLKKQDAEFYQKWRDGRGRPKESKPDREREERFVKPTGKALNAGAEEFKPGQSWLPANLDQVKEFVPGQSWIPGGVVADAAAKKDDVATKSEEYSSNMKEKTGSTLVYKHEDGTTFGPNVLDRLIVGSCVQTPADVDKLHGKGVRIILDLQEDNDKEYFSLDNAPVQKRAAELGVLHVRVPLPDHNPQGLRSNILKALKALKKELDARSEGLAYIHCTAGMGRAPSVALGYMFMVKGEDMDACYKKLFEVWRCHPPLAMVKAAACDLLEQDGDAGQTAVELTIRRPGASKVEIAGLDVGWNERLALEKSGDGDFSLKRCIPPGSYQYKYIIDGNWQPNLDAPTVDDNGNVNNVLEVKASSGGEAQARRERIMAEGSKLKAEELSQLAGLFT
eukprot:TRINITY_DN104620_c0_g1_i1.p1 TRINITY_DN104620_c0_g1~~TRINITY_DN104620_c0_g1_i1.p1  ORF type:complete len:478 (-),score=113.62 TRINITY_DN104620_c0_g1_i1:351-1784(-)